MTDSTQFMRVRDLAVGDQFFMDGRCWTISYRSENGSRVEAREGQFSTIRSFFDPVTAAKAGEFSIDREVKVPSWWI